ncbi:MAG: hypothetical protein H6581_10785 [Bacteroidia bacterium]|nr:hypothetical protein [Bacteroidia bacterium]
MKAIQVLFVLIFLGHSLWSQTLRVDFTNLKTDRFHLTAPGVSNLESNDSPRSYLLNGPGECLVRLAPHLPNGHRVKFEIDSLGLVFPVFWQKTGDDEWQELPGQFFDYNITGNSLKIKDLPGPGELPKLYGLALPGKAKALQHHFDFPKIDSIPRQGISLDPGIGVIHIPRLNSQLGLLVVPYTLRQPGYEPPGVDAGPSGNDVQSIGRIPLPSLQLGFHVNVAPPSSDKRDHPRGYENPNPDSTRNDSNQWIIPVILPVGGGESEKENKTTPPVYVLLKRKLDGGYIKLDQHKLHFKYEGEYNDGALFFEVFDMSRHTVSLPGQTLNKVNGDNRLDLDFTGIAPGFYTLEVTNEKSEQFYIRFQND